MYAEGRVCLSAGAAETKDAIKIRFCREAVQRPDRFARELILDDDLEGALDWVAQRTAQQVIA